ncbi:MAG: alpha-glucan family phosphorylase [Candidatus Eremiobacteraeota bacterium]|nr:alpha-glucan family phosphorylase [Candidatus Eremiobacteraeota bacterium]
MSAVSRPTAHERSSSEPRLHAVTGAALAPRIAYFSMEILLDAGLPTYSGGLGVLAGDMLRSAADLGLPLVGVTLVYHHGYFVQHLDRSGNQHESPELWDPRARMSHVDRTVVVNVEGRDVRVGAWRYDVPGAAGHVVPVYLLDTDIEGNDPHDRALTAALYGGDHRYRLCQETVLGFGGYAMLEALGIGEGIGTFHMNEGHSAFLVPAAIEARVAARGHGEATGEDFASVRKRFVFTTHTPVPAGHDKFDAALTVSVLGEARTRLVERLGAVRDGTLNMTRLALRGSHYINGVAMRHGEVSRALFPGDAIHAITNGVHAGRWTSPAFAVLFDRYVPSWRRDNAYLRHAVGIPLEDICAAHRAAKDDLFVEIKRRCGVALDTSRFTIGFARRAAEYKRGYLPFWDVERLRSLATTVGPLQFVFAGKAHPQDAGGKAVIRQVFEAAERLGGALQVVYLENYEMALAQRLVAGVDLWLNTPRPPLEASGTSGMKAALNGVPSLSTLDGWWIEGCVEGNTGWAIEHDPTASDEDQNAHDARALYAKLEDVILPLFYGDPDGYARVMRGAIAFNGSYFNTQRSVEQYVRGAYSDINA